MSVNYRVPVLAFLYWKPVPVIRIEEARQGLVEKIARNFSTTPCLASSILITGTGFQYKNANT
jgi:hypothetical protein